MVGLVWLGTCVNFYFNLAECGTMIGAKILQVPFQYIYSKRFDGPESYGSLILLSGTIQATELFENEWDTSLNKLL